MQLLYKNLKKKIDSQKIFHRSNSREGKRTAIVNFNDQKQAENLL